MTDIPPLPSHLERFVRGLIATGRFQSEGDVIRAALRLLEGSSSADWPAGSPPEGTAPGQSRRPGRPATTERWERVGGRSAHVAGAGAPPAPAPRSPRGLLADLRSDLSFDDIRDARTELWAGLRPDEAG